MKPTKRTALLVPCLLSILLLSTAKTSGAAAGLTNRITAGIRVPPKTLSVLASTGLVTRTQGLIPIQRNVADQSDVFIRRGTSFVAVPNAFTNIRGDTYLQAPTNTPFLVRPRVPPKPKPLGTNAVVLEGELAMLLSDGRKVGGQVYLQQDQDMGYDPGVNLYRTSVHIGWQTSNNLADIQRLLPVHVRLKTDQLKWSTNYVVIGKPGVPGEGEVVLTAQKCLANPKLTARSSDDSGLVSFGEADVEIVVSCPGFWGFFTLLFPTPLWFALGLGALLGATIRYCFPLPDKGAGKRRKAKGNALGFFRHVAEGILTGLASYILLSVGFTWSETVPPDITRTLLGAMAWGIASGYLGAEVIERMLRPLERTDGKAAD